MKTRIWMSFVLAALFAIPSFAQFQPREFEKEGSEGWSGSSTYSTGRYLDNPCTAVQDLYWVDYAAYAEGAQAEAGVNRWMFNEDTTMGGAYAASGTSSFDVGYGSQFSIRNYHKVNTSDAFHIVTVITFNPAFKTTTLTLETACGDGSPDSAQ